MKKIFVRKDESAREVAGRVREVDETRVILVVPRGSDVGEAVGNFDLIKREAESAGKKIFVESVDENALALAGSLDIESIHPLFERGKRSVMFDIVPVAREEADAASARDLDGRNTSRHKKKEHHFDRPEKDVRAERRNSSRMSRSGDNEEAYGKEEEPLFSDDAPKKNGRHLMAFAILVIVVVCAGAAILIMNKVFGSAEVTIHFKKTPWSFDHAFTADTALSRLDARAYALPAQRFNLEKNVVQSFHASGVKTVSLKAGGAITIYNAYSSAPQTLVATTRFETPDGKIFRLANQAFVPGAEIKDGKIIPATTQANIIADAPGAQYNVGPVARLAIPGFRGSPKYAGFYGEIAHSLKGGFVGVKPVPTPADIKGGKDKTTEILKTALESNLLSSYPSDFKKLDAAVDFNITKLMVSENTDENGNFTVFGDAKISSIGFKESDMQEFASSLAVQDNATGILKDLSLKYNAIKSDMAKGKLSFVVSASGTVTTNFSPDDFKKEIAGRAVDEARFKISQLPGLSNAKISVWPIWLRHIPSDARRIKIVED